MKLALLWQYLYLYTCQNKMIILNSQITFWTQEYARIKKSKSQADSVDSKYPSVQVPKCLSALSAQVLECLKCTSVLQVPCECQVPEWPPRFLGVLKETLDWHWH